MIDIDGIMVPDEGLRTPWGRQPSLISLPYLLTGLELGFDAQSAEIARRIMQIQQRRHGLRVSAADQHLTTPSPRRLCQRAGGDRQPQSAFAPRSHPGANGDHLHPHRLCPVRPVP